MSSEVVVLEKFSFQKERDDQFSNGVVVLAEDYVPSEDEEFMNSLQREYFYKKLTKWRADLCRESQEIVESLQTDSGVLADIIDRASWEADNVLRLRTKDRQRRLVVKIDEALQRLKDGTYGYCEVTGEPISLKRLEVRPVATMNVEAQEIYERSERIHKDERIDG